MANLTTRSLTVSTVSTDNLNKGSALTIAEMDSNFLNLNTDKLENTDSTFTGDLTITSATSSAVGSIKLLEAADNGTNYITVKSPTSLAANLDFILPDDAGSSGYALVTDGSGNLSWSQAAGDITAVIAGAGMTGGATDGSATLNVIAGNGITVNADDVEIDTTVTADLSTAQTLTNKSIDADTNTITNLETDNIKAGTLVIESEGISANDNDTTLPTSAAVKDYVDSNSINNLSEDTTPELGGTLDILGNDIKSSTANVVISAEGTDKDVIIKAKDAGGTLNLHSTFFNNPRVIHDPAGYGGTDVTVYDQVIDTGSIRIGSTQDNFSNDGNAPNADNNYPTTGIIISNGTKKTWPQIALTSHGGDNPLYNRFANSLHIEYPNALINFKASRGTEGSETGLKTGDNIGSFQFNSHDGTAFGGSAARSSASIEVKATEDHNPQETVTILGTSLGGATPANDLVLNITSVDGSGGITGVSIASGTAAGSTPTEYTNVSGQAPEPEGSGSSATFDIKDEGDGTYSLTDGLGAAGDGINAAGSGYVTDSVTDRAAKVTFNVMPTGGNGSKAVRDTVIEAAGDSVKIGNQTDGKYITMDSSNGELDFTDTVIKLGEVGSAPSTASDHGFVYAKDDTGTAEVYVKDGAGNETKISPHNQTGEWEYYSVNRSTGKTVRVNMEKMIRKLEEITGETFIENE